MAANTCANVSTGGILSSAPDNGPRANIAPRDAPASALRPTARNVSPAKVKTLRAECFFIAAPLQRFAPLPRELPLSASPSLRTIRGALARMPYPRGWSMPHVCRTLEDGPSAFSVWRSQSSRHLCRVVSHYPVWMLHPIGDTAARAGIIDTRHPPARTCRTRHRCPPPVFCKGLPIVGEGHPHRVRAPARELELMRCPPSLNCRTNDMRRSSSP